VTGGLSGGVRWLFIREKMGGGEKVLDKEGVENDGGASADFCRFCLAGIMGVTVM